MIKLENYVVEQNHFPDGTLLLKEKVWYDIQQNGARIKWLFESNEELLTLIFLTKHLRAHGVKNVSLYMPYVPNGRMDRVKNRDDVFTLKYFAEIINSLNFDYVKVLDPHSYVSEALIDNICVEKADTYIDKTLIDLIKMHGGKIRLTYFYPDEGAMKRYSSASDAPYVFGIKKRNWETGKIEGLDVAGCVDKIKDSNILIVDDICSRGGTFYHSAKKLKELGANKIYLYVTHCENTILEGDLLTSGLIEKVYTTNSIFTKEHEKIEVFEL